MWNERGEQVMADDTADESVAIQAIARAARMLRLFTTQRPALTLNELTKGFGMGKTTTHRYATSLRQCGLLRYDDSSARYLLGIRLVELGQIAQGSLYVFQVAGPHLEALASELNETVVLSVWDGEAAVAMRVAEAPRRTTYQAVRIGARLRANGAHDSVFKAFLRLDSTDLELARVRQQGLAIRDTPDDDVRVIACPLFEGEQIVAAVAVISIPRRLSMDPHSEIARKLQRRARQISAELGPLRAETARE
jgi:DNA-binding IclR family transcriptional regulator